MKLFKKIKNQLKKMNFKKIKLIILDKLNRNILIYPINKSNRINNLIYQ